MYVGCVLSVFTCGLYVYEAAHVYEFVWRFMVINQSFLSTSSYLLKQGCLLDPGAHYIASLASQFSSELPSL